MKKFLIVVLCFSACLLVGCKESKESEEPPVDNVKTIVVCSEFYNETFYINDLVELKDYTAIVTYESGTTETLKLTSFGFSVLDTTSVGEKSLNLSYKGKDFTINYVVLDILPISAMYKGGTLEFFKSEEYNFSRVFVSVLYNNGEERNISLDEFNKSNIDKTLTIETKTFTATYNGVSVNIPYTVTNRPIEEGVDYNFDDTLDIFNDNAVKIRFMSGSLLIHNNDDENRVVALNQTATEFDFNRYWTTVVYNNFPTKIYFYLVNDTIFCELLEE